MRKLKTLLLISGILSGLVIFLLYLISGMYGDQVEVYIKNELNKKFGTKIHISSIEFTAFKKFPWAALEVSDFTIDDPLNANDTLFYTSKLYLQFNLLNIIRQNFEVEKISVSSGFTNLKVDKTGKENYISLTGKENQDQENTAFKVEKFVLNNFFVRYCNGLKSDTINLHIDQLSAFGKAFNSIYELKIAGDFQIDNLKTGDFSYLKNKYLSVDAALNINNNKKTIGVERGKLTINEGLQFMLWGTAEDKGDYFLSALQISGKKLNLVKMLTLLPSQSEQFLREYKSDGTLFFQATINGKVSKEQTPEINAKFGIENGKIAYAKTGSAITNIFFEGSYSNGSLRNEASSSIKINNLKANIGEGSLNGSFSINNFLSPLVDGNVSGEFRLEELHRFFNLDTLEKMDGYITINAAYKGKIKNRNKLEAEDLLKARTSGKIEVRESIFQVKGEKTMLDLDSAIFSFEENNVNLSCFNGKYGDSDFKIKGSLNNFLPWLLLKKEKLKLTSSFVSDTLDLNTLFKNDEESADTTYHFSLPENIEFTSKIKVGALFFRKFTASAIRGTANYSNNKFVADPLYFDALNGTTSARFALFKGKKAFLLNAEANINKVAIERLFYELENFGQEVIIDRHLKGIANADIVFSAEMDSLLNIDPASVKTTANLSIQGGELIDFGPLQHISGYIKNHKLLSLLIKADELGSAMQHVRFSTLKNRVNIENEKVFIPEMEIRSSAMDINIEGEHAFNDSIHYRLNFFLSQLLTRNKEKAQKGKTRIYLKMAGTASNPIISYDKKGAKNKAREDIKNEQNTIKTIMHEEFGVFEGDTTVKKMQKENKKKDFELIWEEDQDSTPAPDPGNEQQKQGKNGLFNILNQDKKKKKKEKLNFEDEDF